TRITIATKAGAPLMAWAFHGDFALLVPPFEGGEPRALLEAALRKTPGEHLGATPSFLDAAGHVPSLGDGVIFFDGDGLFTLQTKGAGEEEKRGLRRVYDVLRGLAIGFRLTEKDLAAE